MKIASIQLNISWEDKEENLKRASQFVEKAAKENCDLIVFPEMFTSGFSMNSTEIAEVVSVAKQDSLTSATLCSLAKKNSINIIAGFVEKNQTQIENIAVFIARDGKIQARYVKNYPFSFAKEDQFYASGNEQVVFDLEGSSASTFICYDLRFPELFRKVAKQIDIIFVIANWPVNRQMHWETLLKARAIENQCFVVGVNRIGVDGNEMKYGGGSCVFDPLGALLSRGESIQEYIVTEIDLSEASKVRKALPFLSDMKD